jgi:hypothetical protein
MKKMWVVILVVVFSSYALAAPMAVTTVNPNPADLALEVQELIILRDYYKFLPVQSQDSKNQRAKKLKEYEDRLASKTANLYKLADAAIKRPNYGGFDYSLLKYFNWIYRLLSALLNL